jgi:hypothetical protein
MERQKWRQKQALGCKSEFELIHPDHLNFVNVFFASQRWTSRRSNLANGELLLRAIIFAAKSMKREWVTGFDPFAEWIGNEDNFKKNCGDDKPYPFNSSCFLKGKEIPCSCCNSSGSINGSAPNFHASLH